MISPIKIVANEMTAEDFADAVAAGAAVASGCRNQSLLVPQPSRYEKQQPSNAVNVLSDLTKEKRATGSARLNPASDFGPPPGYQPIILPGESISKYQRLSQGQSAAAPRAPQPALHHQIEEPSAPALASTFPEDEPLFAEAATQPQHAPAQHSSSPRVEQQPESAWDREQKRLHQMNVAAVFGGSIAEEVEEPAPQSGASPSP